MSLAVGGLWALEAGAEVWGRRPVRTIGGCSSVDIAVAVSGKRLLCHSVAPTILTGLQNTVAPGPLI